MASEEETALQTKKYSTASQLRAIQQLVQLVLIEHSHIILLQNTVI